ncbi:MAG: molybdopterin-dependent oxidoreductase [Candidatus Tectomicrobia bacterium]|nr:molybdopterin-dependent oxidoreductase [Candidatus Tectomicrobia bacterium]
MSESDLRYIGKSVKKKDAFLKVTGRARYTADLPMPRALTVRILRSPVPHARIRGIDASKALALPGVKAVLTHENTPDVLYNSYWREPVDDDRLLPDERAFSPVVRHVGDRVAAVAATSPQTAEEALDLIEVDYEHLPVVGDPEKALEPGAPAVHGGTNLLKHVEWTIGSVEEGFRECAVVVEDSFETHVVQHAPMETHTYAAEYDAYAARLTVWTSTQGVHNIRILLAKVLGMPLTRIRVIKPFTGGSFGGKNDLFDEIVVALMAMRTGRPVRLTLTRWEEFVGTRTRHANRMRLKLGFKADGTMHARELRAYLNAGAYSAASPKVAMTTGHRWMMLYRTPHVRYEGFAAYTNFPVAGAFRGFGTPQQTFAMEVLMDRAARDLGVDALELRLKNHVRVGDWDEMSKITIRSSGMEECIRKGAEAVGWAEKRGKRLRSGSKVRGVGMAIGTHNTGVKPFVNEITGAVLKLNEDGTVNIAVGACDLGQGSDTILAQVAAEVLGIDPDRIDVFSGDTEFCPYDNGTHSSRQAYLAGNAVRLAALEARDQLLAAVADKLEAAPQDLACADGRISVRSAPDRALRFEEAAMYAIHCDKNVQVMGRGTFAPETNCPPFLAQFAEVEVDTETGEVRVLKLVCAHDLGRAINPQICEGQIEGGAGQGVGYTLIEHLVVDPATCLPLNANIVDYRIACSEDMPEETIPILVESHEPTGPWGAKGLAEPALVGIAPAIANAVIDATGARINSLPINAERLLAMLKGNGA